jgi:LysM repeat protein
MRSTWFAGNTGRIRRIVCLIGVLFLLFTWSGGYPTYADDGGVYTVRPGDTLISIAARHGVTVNQLAIANGLRWSAWVYVGQRLRIPGRTSSSPAATGGATASGGTYVVRRGDTLSGIAARHGVTVSQLAAANRLRRNAWVYAGQRLKIPGRAAAPAAPASSTTAPAGGTYVVRRGDTLISIAARHGVKVSQLAMANGLHTNSWVYTGQRLKIPGRAAASTGSAPSSTGGTYVVRPGDTLIRIAVRHGVSVSRLAAVNGLRTTSWVYVSQRLSIPGQGSTPSTGATAPVSHGAKWIDINLSTQTLTAYENRTAVFRTKVSTGTWRTPTPVGTFRIYSKYRAVHMRGPGYSLPNVPYTMYFYGNYALHGTYWHNNFGTPMSHGCVNLPTTYAQRLYNWAPNGTKVVSHR